MRASVRGSVSFWHIAMMIMVSIVVQSVIDHKTLDARVTFATKGSTFVLKDIYSNVQFAQTNKITGWSQGSIARDYGNNEPSIWLPVQYNNDVLGFAQDQIDPSRFYIPQDRQLYIQEDTVIDGQGRTLELEANAQILVDFGVTLTLRDMKITTVSNNPTNPIIRLIGQAGKLALQNVELVRTISHAFIYCCKNTSNALLNLGVQIKNNSNAILNLDAVGTDLAENNSSTILYLDSIIRTNSNAFGYCCKNTSNALINLSQVGTDLAKQNSHLLNYALSIYDNHQLYTDHTREQNLVFFKDGFTVDPGKILTLNTPLAATGNINLNDTGVLKLENDFYLGSNAYLTNGGEIRGGGYSLVLSCSFEIPESQKIYVTEDTIINGHHTTLTLEPHAQIIVDYGVTLTLKNLRIRNTRNALLSPMISLVGSDAKLALQNVELEIADDFMFTKGALFVHDDVLVSGTSTFSYRSIQPSYIDDDSTLGFDKGLTFLYYPSTDDNHLIKMLSKTSTMYLDGATLQTTHTGMYLNKGTLCLDNKITLNSRAATRLSSLYGVTSKDFGITTTIYTVDWHPSGKYLAVGSDEGPGGSEFVGNELRIYQFDTYPTPNIVGLTSVDHATYDLYKVKWSPNGKYLGVLVYNPGQLVVYDFDGDELTNARTINIGPSAKSFGWSPEGRYIGVGAFTNNGHELRVYEFDPLGSPAFIHRTSEEEGKKVNAVAWHPTGHYLALGTDLGPTPGDAGVGAGHELQLFRWDTTSTPTMIGVASKDMGSKSHVLSADWSPNGRYLAIGTTANPNAATDGGVIYEHELRVYQFDEATETLTGLTSINSTGVNNIYSIKWSPDGQYLAIGTNANGNEFNIYRFNGTSLTSIAGRDQGDEYTVHAVSWTPDGQYVAIGTAANPSTSHDDIVAGEELRIYRANYTLDTNAQSCSNAIFWDNFASAGDDALDVYKLPSARLDVTNSRVEVDVNSLN